MKKMINKPDAFVDEFVQGLLSAHADELRPVTEDDRALVRTDAGSGGKVGIVTGGGSGHLPFFLGYVGRGLASGVAIGNVFSSPSAEQIFAATVASDDGAGVLYLYGNYGGDVYNFDIAGDLAAADGIRTATVLGTDDVSSAPADRAESRRGVAGLVFAFKTAGAAAERGDDLDTVAAIAQRTCDRTRTMGVGLSPTILPAAGEPTFTVEEGEMEIGIGIHGEPGQHRGPLESADEITDRFLAGLLPELELAEGDRVAVLVNGLGATPLEELYLVYRRAHQVLAERGVTVHRPYVGEYVTSLEMAGASLSILRLDDELAELVDAPASSPFFRQGAVEPASAPVEPVAQRQQVPTKRSQAEQVRTVTDPGNLRDVVLAVTERLPKYSDELRDLDAAVGDGDLGITVSAGTGAVHDAVSALPYDAHPSEVFKAAGAAFASANPSTFAALVGGGLLSAAQALSDVRRFGARELAVATRAALGQITERGGAEVGDKTFVDVLVPVLESLETSSGQPAPAVAEGVVDSARNAVHNGVDTVAKRGRASWIGERSAGHADPGSVALLRLVEEVAHQL